MARGKSPLITEKNFGELKKLHKDGMTYHEISELTGFSHTVVSKALKYDRYEDVLRDRKKAIDYHRKKVKEASKAKKDETSDVFAEIACHLSRIATALETMNLTAALKSMEKDMEKKKKGFFKR